MASQASGKANRAWAVAAVVVVVVFLVSLGVWLVRRDGDEAAVSTTSTAPATTTAAPTSTEAPATTAAPTTAPTTSAPTTAVTTAPPAVASASIDGEPYDVVHSCRIDPRPDQPLFVHLLESEAGVRAMVEQWVDAESGPGVDLRFTSEGPLGNGARPEASAPVDDHGGPVDATLVATDGSAVRLVLVPDAAEAAQPCDDTAVVQSPGEGGDGDRYAIVDICYAEADRDPDAEVQAVAYLTEASKLWLTERVDGRVEAALVRRNLPALVTPAGESGTRSVGARQVEWVVPVAEEGGSGEAGQVAASTRGLGVSARPCPAGEIGD